MLFKLPPYLGDHDVAILIRRRVVRESISIRRSLVFMATVGIISGFCTFLGDLFRLPKQWECVVNGIIVFLVVLGFSTIQRRHERQALASILRQLYRCERCGYNLSSTTDTQCPECGREFASEKLGTMREE
jgi:hypothetical protein